MGLLINVYRGEHDCTNGGVSSTHRTLCVVNCDGPFEPSEGHPAVMLQQHIPGYLRIIPAYWGRDGGWYPDKYCHRMNGGNLGGTSDGRFAAKCEQLLGYPFYGAVYIHDRVE